MFFKKIKISKSIDQIFYFIFMTLLGSCGLHHQNFEKKTELIGAFGFHFGAKVQGYEIKSEEDELMIVEPTVIPRPNSLIERYALKLDRKTKRISEIIGLNHSFQQRQCLQAKEELVSSIKERYNFEKTESLEDLEFRPKKSVFYGESANKFGVVVGCLMNIGFVYSNSDTLLIIRYFAPSAKNSMQLLSQ